MLSSQEQMEIIKGALAEGYKGPIFKLIEQANFRKQEEAAQQEQPEQRETGGLVQSYESKPPSLEMLPTGDKVGKYDTLENAGIYKSGGFKKYHEGGPAHTHTEPPKEKFKTGVNSFVSGTPIQDQYDDLITIKELGAGNSRTFTDDNKHNTLINKMINKGTHGYNPKTGALIKLDTPLKGLSKEEEFMGTRAYAKNVASGNKGFTSKKQDAQIKKLPKEQQEKINAANYNLRKNLVGKQNQKMVQNPLYYAPGVIAATAFGAPALAAAGEATFASAAPSVAAAWNTSIPGLTALGEGATIGNAINAGFATHGAMNIIPDVQDFVKKPSLGGAGKIGMDALEIAPVVGPAFRTGVEGLSAAKNVGQNAYKLNPLKVSTKTNKLKPTSKELAATPTQNSPSPLLPEHAPYLSKIITEVPKDERIFRSFLSPETRLKLEAGDIKHFDPQGNPIINNSKKLPGSPNSFKSEIDWGKFNKEIPGNKPLMKEYNAIEQQAKADGTWMKNPDGSKFTGTPEQFVQQNSKNFKKAFPDILKDPQTSSANILSHHSPNKFDSFDKAYNLSGVGAAKYGEGVYTVPKKYYDKYMTQSVKELGSGPGQKPVLVGYGKNRYDLYTNKTGVNQFRKREPSYGTSTSPIPSYKTEYNTAVIPYSNKVKSAIGNSGMFDMTNPNIYKAIVPGAIATGAALGFKDSKKNMKTGGFIDRKVLYNKVNSKKIKKRKR